MTDRIRLSDDGTMDTVFVCDECGKEIRTNYGSYCEMLDADDLSNVDESDDEAVYYAWVDSERNDIESEHECGPDRFIECAHCHIVTELFWSDGELVCSDCLPTPTVADRGAW